MFKRKTQEIINKNIISSGRKNSEREKIIEIKDIVVSFPLKEGELVALDRVSLDVYRGETLGIVGESGCGKSTLGFTMLNFVQSPGRIINGKVLFHGENLLEKPKNEIRKIRGKSISMIFQDPMTSLNPLMRVDRHIMETLKIHQKIDKKKAKEKAVYLLEKLGIAKERIFDYPHQLSGGMRQRVMIGIGLILNAEVIIADEPTTSLDVIVEAQFIDLLKQLKDEFGLTLILITHNMGIVAQISDRIVVMYGGKIMEVGETNVLFTSPLHPYTEGLLHSIPSTKLEEESLISMPGFPPDLLNPPSGCRFSPRCRYAFKRCFSETPPVYQMGERFVSCFRYEQQLKKIHSSYITD